MSSVPPRKGPPPRQSRPGQAKPRSVYLRRQIMGLAILALLVWGVIAGVGAVVGWVGGFFGAGPSQTAAPSGECAAGKVVVEAYVGDATGTPTESFAMSETPYIWLSLTNIGTTACTFNAGPDVQFFTIKSGPDLIWQSSDCDRVGLPSQEVTLQPNTVVKTTPSEWMRVRSSSAGCGAGQMIVDAGAYNLTATVNGVISQPNQFLLK
jgi:hypothetical protein